MRLGLDFDNTIVEYGAVFHERAVERGWIPPTVEPTKQAVRAFLRDKRDGEARWTELQGEVYGSHMMRASMADGLKTFLLGCKARGIPVVIVSHKTMYPFLGARVNLHEAALGWLRANAFEELGIESRHWFFELTKEAKMARIADQQCTHFVDDLEEILCAPQFPPRVVKLHYCPGLAAPATRPDIVRCHSWQEVAGQLF